MGLVLVIVISGYFDMIILHKDNPIYSSHGKDNYLERFMGSKHVLLDVIFSGLGW